jgi:hypothetical protein
VVLENLSSRFEDRLHGRLRSRLYRELSRRKPLVVNAS